MKKSYMALLTIVILLVSVLIAWNIAYPSVSWRYKITIIVETPEGIKIGSAVKEVRVFAAPAIGGTGGGNATTIGEAVLIDLGKYGHLFALTYTDEYFVFLNTFPGPPILTTEGIEYYTTLRATRTSVPKRGAWPRMMFYKDVLDPISGKLVDPNDMSSTLGEGFVLKDVTIETSNEPITHKIEQYLPWLKNMEGNLYGDQIISQGGPLGSIDKSDFIVEEIE